MFEILEHLLYRIPLNKTTCSYKCILSALWLYIIRPHHVFYGVESWSGVMEWGIGVESNFGVAKILITPVDSVYLTFSYIWTGLF